MQSEKGETSNPNGRPLGTPNRSTIAKRILEMTSIFPDKVFDKMREQYPEISKKTTVEEMIMIVQSHKAIAKQDTQAANFMMDNVYGKALQQTDLTSKGERIETIRVFEIPDNGRAGDN